MRSSLFVRFALCAAAGALLVPVVTRAQEGGYATDLIVDAQSQRSVDRGRPFAYAAVVSNKGPATAHEVTLSLALPAGVQFDRNGSDPSCVTSRYGATCALGSLGIAQTRTVLLQLRTAYQDSCAPITSVLQSEVASAEQEVTPLNNVATPWYVSILCTPRPPECSDTVDNDGDGLVDMADPGCASPAVDDERRDEREAAGGIRPRFFIMPVQSSSSSLSSSVSFPTLAPDLSPRASHPMGVRLTLRPDRTEVLPGDTVGVTLLVHNRSDVPVVGTRVRLSFDPSRLDVVADFAESREEDAVTWRVDLAADQTRVIRFRAVVSPWTPAGEAVSLAARADNVARSPVASLTLPVIALLPQTGAGFTGALENPSSFLSPLSRSASVAPLIVILFAVSSLAIAGGFLLRRARGHA